MSKYIVATDAESTRVAIPRSAAILGLDDLPCPEASVVVYDFADILLFSSPMVGSLLRTLRERGSRRTVIRISKGNHAVLKLLGLTRMPDLNLEIEIVPSPGGRER